MRGQEAKPEPASLLGFAIIRDPGRVIWGDLGPHVGFAGCLLQNFFFGAVGYHYWKLLLANHPSPTCR